MSPGTRRSYATKTAAAVCWLLLAVSLPVFGQGVLDQYEPDHADEAEDVCPWEGVNQRPELARECLRLAGINEDLAEYAFPHPPSPGHTLTDTAVPPGVVPRWAMAEAISRALDKAGADLPEINPETIEDPYPDIGWLTPERQKPIYHLRDIEPAVASGFRDGGYHAEWPVDRWQMALFFVRTLRAIDRDNPDNIPALDVNRIWQDLEETPIDRVRMPFPDPEIAAWKHWPEESHERYRAVALLFDLGISYGNEEGLYLPDEMVTGDQMAMFIVRLLAHTNIRAGEGTETPNIQPPPEGRPVYLQPVEASTPIDTLLTPDPLTRPPREIDYYRYSFSLSARFGVQYDGSALEMSEPFDLQIGDWYWNNPTGRLTPRRLYVFAAFASAGSYAESFPVMNAYTCLFDESGNSVNAVTGEIVFKPGPNLFQLTSRVQGGGALPPVDCSSLPAPAGGYTAEYPCGSESAYVRQIFEAECGP